MSDTEKNVKEGTEPSHPSFVEEWCKLYGLDAETAEYLTSHGYATGDDLVTLRVDDIKRFTDLDDVRKWLLPGAITRYRQGRAAADKQLEQRGVEIIKKSREDVNTKNLGHLWRFHAKNVAKTTTVAERLMTPNKRQAYLELKKRLQESRPALTAEQLDEKVNEMLASLLTTGLVGAPQDTDPDGDSEAPEVDLEDSKRKTDEALLKLETELFTEDELRLVAKVKELQEKHNNTESAEYERDLDDLIATM